MDDLHGLIVCGGKSSRMGVDKSLLEYYGIPHRYYLFNLLQNFCQSVYLSVNIFQTENLDNSYSFIIDAPEYSNIGPMSALLSAWKKFPQASWLVVGCDYPFVNKEILQSLISQRNKRATCFHVDKNNINEPLFTIYESSFYPAVIESYHQQNYSLSKLLANENVNTVKLSSGHFLKNVNTMDEFFAVKELLNIQSL